MESIINKFRCAVFNGNFNYKLEDIGGYCRRPLRPNVREVLAMIAGYQ
jgi:hypothetical protein